MAFLQENLWYFVMGTAIMFVFVFARSQHHVNMLVLRWKSRGKRMPQKPPDVTELMRRLSEKSGGRRIDTSVFNTPTVIHYFAQQYAFKEWTRKRKELLTTQMQKFKEKRDPQCNQYPEIPSEIQAELVRHQDNVRRAKEAAEFVNERPRDKSMLKKYFMKKTEPRFRTVNIHQCDGANNDHLNSGLVNKREIEEMMRNQGEKKDGK